MKSWDKDSQHSPAPGKGNSTGLDTQGVMQVAGKENGNQLAELPLYGYIPLMLVASATLETARI